MVKLSSTLVYGHETVRQVTRASKQGKPTSQVRLSMRDMGPDVCSSHASCSANYWRQASWCGSERSVQGVAAAERVQRSFLGQG